MPLMPWLSIPDPRLTGTDDVLTYYASEDSRVSDEYIIGGVQGTVIVLPREAGDEYTYRVERTRR